MTSGVTDKLQTDLRHQLKALSARFWQLSARLAQAAKDLQDPGLPPSPQLLDDLTAAQKDFVAIRAQLLELAWLAHPASLPDEDKIVSLKDLVEVLHSTLETKKKAKSAEAQHQAAQTLELILQLAHKDKPDFAPLAECQAKARKLQSALAGVDWANPNPELDSRLLPFIDLATIVEQLDHLDDEALEHLQEAPAQAFGKLLTVAAARGNLLFRETASAPLAPPAVEAGPPPLVGAPAEAAEPQLPQAEAPHPAEVSAGPDAAPGAPVLANEAASPTAATEPLTLEPGELPKLVSELYVLLGHEVQKAIPRAGHDVDLVIRSSNGKKWLARCRDLEEAVEEVEVRDFYGVMQQEKAAQGAIIAVGSFTLPARQWAKSNLLYLLDKKEFFDYLRQARARP